MRCRSSAPQTWTSLLPRVCVGELLWVGMGWVWVGLGGGCGGSPWAVNVDLSSALGSTTLTIALPHTQTATVAHPKPKSPAVKRAGGKEQGALTVRDVALLLRQPQEEHELEAGEEAAAAGQEAPAADAAVSPRQRAAAAAAARAAAAAAARG